MLSTSESTILRQALDALKAETGISLQLDKQAALREGADALIKTPAQLLAAEIKHNVRQAHLGAIMQKLKAKNRAGVLIADYLNPKIAKTLKENHIQYLDACGNVYLNLPPLYVHIAGQRPVHDTKSRNSNKTFDFTGLKIIYGILCDEDLINASYREIAKTTEVALGAVGGILQGLIDLGYLIDTGKPGQRQLINRHKLFERWVEAYPEKLRPKLHLGTLVSPQPDWWKTFDVTAYKALWGGEIAATKSVSMLKPQIATVYLPEAARTKFIAAAKLKKANSKADAQPGAVEIYQVFWNADESNQPVQNCVHPILTYADLLATADSRNLEAARKLYETTLVRYFREN